MKKPATSPNYRIRAVGRALDILEAFTFNEPELDLNAICERAGLPKSTAFKIIAVLENRGYLQKDPANGSYRIGFQSFDVGNRYLAGLTLFGVVHPFLKKLAARFPRAVAHLAILSPTDAQIVYLDIVSRDISLFLVPVGTRTYVHCTALGKCLLAGLPEEELDRRLVQLEMPKMTQHTIIDSEALREHLNMVRAQGYSVDDEELTLGNLCVAIPVRDRRGATVAAISTSHVKGVMSDDVAAIIAEMCQTARDVARSLGHVPLPTPAEG